jgi:hypothetical protein
LTPIVFDIEANQLEFNEALRIWMLAYRLPGESPKWLKGDEIPAWFAGLPADAVLVGHNVLRYDLPAIRQAYGVSWPVERTWDTLVASKMACADRHGHSLESWGETFQMPKGKFEDFEGGLSDEMVRYCLRDVEVTSKLYAHLLRIAPWLDGYCMDLERRFALRIGGMCARGAPYDLAAALDLLDKCKDAENPLLDELRALVPDRLEEGKRPAYYEDPTTGERYKFKNLAETAVQKRLVAGPSAVSSIPFNPRSTKQVADLLVTKYDWKPTELTETGQPQVSEEVLERLEYPEARLVLDIKLRANLVSKLASWNSKVVNGRVHGYVDHYGAVTGRCTHSDPNLANIPVHSPIFAECRGLFRAPEGRVLVGVDAAKLELVMLAHYLYPFDNGEYAELVQSGDPHQRTLEGTGLIERLPILVDAGFTEEQARKALRNQAKRFIYALIYGGGDVKLGALVEPSALELEEIRVRQVAKVREYERRFAKRFPDRAVPDYVGPFGVIGGRLRERFMAAMPAYEALLASVQAQFGTGKGLKTLTGARLFPRGRNSALNTLLQGGGAAVIKQATVDFCDGLANFLDAWMVLHTHDEIQTECCARDGEAIGRLCGESMTGAARKLNVRLPLGYEAKIGKSWKETH